MSLYCIICQYSVVTTIVPTQVDKNASRTLFKPCTINLCWYDSILYMMGDKTVMHVSITISLRFTLLVALLYLA